MARARRVGEGNFDDKTGAAYVANTTLSYLPSPSLEIYVSVHNVLDAEFESFGLYGEPDEVLPDLETDDNRFLSPNELRGAWFGIRYSWE